MLSAEYSFTLTIDSQSEELTELRITEDIQRDIHGRLVSTYPEMEYLEMGPFSQILGGATQTIYSFDLLSNSKSIPLILRVYDSNQREDAKKEFQTIQDLYKRGLQVSRPYILVLDSKVLETPHAVLEYIDGPMLSDVLMDLRSGTRFESLLQQYTKNMASLHSLDWSGEFLYLDSRGMRENPEVFALRELARPKEIVMKHHVKELQPVIDWMEKNAVITHEPCLIHGDYHGMNVIVRDERELVTIDWNSARIGDYRFDLAYAIITLTSADLDVEEKIVKHYQKVTGKEVQNLEYFKALSSIWNLLRIYSCLFDRSVMGETDETVRLFVKEYHEYSRFTIETVQHVTGIDLTRLLDAIDAS